MCFGPIHRHIHPGCLSPQDQGSRSLEQLQGRMTGQQRWSWPEVTLPSYACVRMGDQPWSDGYRRLLLRRSIQRGTGRAYSSQTEDLSSWLLHIFEHMDE